MPSSNLAKTAGFYFKWLAKSSLDPIFRRWSRSELRTLLDAYPDDSVASVRAIGERYKGFGYYKRLRPFQVPTEHEQLLEFVKKINPAVVVEIGTADGGTLLGWCRIARDVVVSIDQPLKPLTKGYAAVRQHLYRDFSHGRPNLKLHLVFGNSQIQETRDRVEQILAGREVDFLLIDGDHMYEGVRKDFEIWNSIVRPGGYIGFHDIIPHKNPARSQVDRLWTELRPKYKHVEIIADKQQGWAGIGLLQVPG